MTETPEPTRVSARIAVIAALAIVWIAVLVWLWPGEIVSESCFAYAPLTEGGGPCAEAIRAEERSRAWFLPALAAGPALAAVAWFTLRPKDRG
ncbi:hypothetical protein [Glycomyces tarimensis]